MKRKDPLFIVKKNGRVVDCLRSKTLEKAFDEVMGKWDEWLRDKDVIEVEAKDEQVILPTLAETKLYAGIQA